MTALFFLPELVFSLFLAVTLTSINSDKISSRVLSLFYLVLSSMMGVYYALRPEIGTDPVTTYAKVFFLLIYPWFVLMIQNQKDRSGYQKKRNYIYLLILFFSALLAVQIQQVMVFSAAWLIGLFACFMMMIDESGHHPQLLKKIKNLLVLVLLGYIFSWLIFIFQAQHLFKIIFGLFVSFSIILVPYWVTLFKFNIPTSLGLLSIWIYFCSFVYWFRFGFLEITATEKWVVIGFWLLGSFLSSLKSLQDRSSETWYGSATYSILLLGLIPLLTDVQESMYRFILFFTLYVLVILIGNTALIHKNKYLYLQEWLAPLLVLLIPFSVSTYTKFPEIISLIFNGSWLLLMISFITVILSGVYQKNRQKNDSMSKNSLTYPPLFMTIILLMIMLFVTVFHEPVIHIFTQHSLKHL